MDTTLNAAERTTDRRGGAWRAAGRVGAAVWRGVMAVAMARMPADGAGRRLVVGGKLVMVGREASADRAGEKAGR